MKGSGITETARMLAQRQPSFKKCVTAYWSSDSAPKNVRGYKLATEALDPEFILGGRGAFLYGMKGNRKDTWTERK